MWSFSITTFISVPQLVAQRSLKTWHRGEFHLITAQDGIVGTTWFLWQQSMSRSSTHTPKITLTHSKRTFLVHKTGKPFIQWKIFPAIFHQVTAKCQGNHATLENVLHTMDVVIRHLDKSLVYLSFRYVTYVPLADTMAAGIRIWSWVLQTNQKCLEHIWQVLHKNRWHTSLCSCTCSPPISSHKIHRAGLEEGMAEACSW